MTWPEVKSQSFARAPRHPPDTVSNPFAHHPHSLHTGLQSQGHVHGSHTRQNHFYGFAPFHCQYCLSLLPSSLLVDLDPTLWRFPGRTEVQSTHLSLNIRCTCNMPLVDTHCWVLSQVFRDIIKRSQSGLNSHYFTLVSLFLLHHNTEIPVRYCSFTEHWCPCMMPGWFPDLLVWVISQWLLPPSSFPNQTLVLRQSREQCLHSSLLSSIKGCKFCIHYLIDVIVVSHEYEYLPCSMPSLFISLSNSHMSQSWTEMPHWGQIHQLITSPCSSDD